MIKPSFGLTDDSVSEDKSVAERVRQRETSPSQAAQAGVIRVSLALQNVFADVRPRREK
ncbi:hypothetical protein [Blastomonas aquatica]|uniref:hypothetical protein n=1 Tax=Blastomonas aquatica TaxID=1510276 RepID=UPI00166AE4ED|nr:hypothetical protein [Blastomonas aquatica]